MTELHKPTPEQRRRAWVSAVVLVATVLAIYGVFVFKMASQAGP
jgi:hypothetical protein